MISIERKIYRPQLSIDHDKIASQKRYLVGMVFVLTFLAGGALLKAGESGSATRSLRLTPERDHYFLGPYLDYLEDPDKKLDIDDVSSPQMANQYIKHKRKLLNLGLNSYAYWIRFTVNLSAVRDSDRKWLLYFGWPNPIDYATL
ncbi:hypothetical protein D1AOALGA4SA_8979 [Olavius algarvensis Delta 1 endosymbiont]|nr:hypothetical protein D1AOALGA4SA_8979 [Olavius algarvensis Delta 1 endosymbiont]